MATAKDRHPDQTAAQPAPSRPAGQAMGVIHTLLGLSLLFVVFINVANAASRYLFGISPVGADELMVYVVIWVVMLAAILSLILRSHINVNLLPLYTRGRARHVLHVIHDVAAILACGYATYASWLFIGRISKLGVTSMGLGLPMTVPHAALLFGFAALTVTGAAMLVRDVLALRRNAPHFGADP
jgi:TRAP-type C4-dicarboxylate transport system permease small subunit